MFALKPQCASPAEKVLELFQNLPHSREALIAEAVRAEALLAALPPAQTEEGEQMLQRLADIFQAHIEAIDGLLDYADSGDESVLEESLALLMESAQELDALDEVSTATREDLVMVA